METFTELAAAHGDTMATQAAAARTRTKLFRLAVVGTGWLKEGISEASFFNLILFSNLTVMIKALVLHMRIKGQMHARHSDNTLYPATTSIKFQWRLH